MKENLNIDLEIIQMESGAYVDAANAGQLEGLYLFGWTGDYPDPTNFNDFHFGTGATDQFGTKWAGITSRLTQAAQLGDEEAHRALYTEVNDLLKQHVPMIPISHGASAAAYLATVEGAHASPLGNESLEVMSVPGQETFTFMQNAEPIGLYCGDESDGESLRVCEQIMESLLWNTVFAGLPLPFGGLETALFFDAGLVWDNDSNIKWNRDPGDPYIDASPIGGPSQEVRSVVRSWGAALQGNLLGFLPLRLDYSRPLNRPMVNHYWTLSLGPTF